MFGLTTTHTFHLYSKLTDMRKGFNGLCGVTQNHLSASPTNGSVYILINKTRDKVKLEEGIDLRYIQVLLEHNSSKTTEI